MLLARNEGTMLDAGGQQFADCEVVGRCIVCSTPRHADGYTQETTTGGYIFQVLEIDFEPNVTVSVTDENKMCGGHRLSTTTGLCWENVE